ncbi:MAG: hypothetical protein EXS09_16935 [Gemmataceae bacterium]|nr:hypothetical protein [Gemmataceae bacterium]
MAHKSGLIIHRDLKPANLIIVNTGTPQEHLRVMDFGLDLHLNLNKPNPAKSKREITVVLYVPHGGAPKDPAAWRGRDLLICEKRWSRCDPVAEQAARLLGNSKAGGPPALRNLASILMVKDTSPHGHSC